MYINKIEKRITFKIKKGYYLELLTPEKMKLFGGSKSKITKDENGDNVPHLEINELMLVHYNIVNKDYQQDSRVLLTFIPNKSFGQLLHILPKNFIFSKILIFTIFKFLNSEFSYIEVSFTDQDSKPLETED